MVADAGDGTRRRRGRGPQNVKTDDSEKSRHLGFSTGPRLERTTFSTSREMDFFTEKELVTQTGHGMQEWPFVIVKELVDNALDACEEADTAPDVRITADAAGITVEDNGPGLPESTLQGALDFRVRVSNREQYVAPDRGAQGNALKTLLTMPRVLDPEHGKLIVTANGVRHHITCGCDPISQQAVIHHDRENVKKRDLDATELPRLHGTSIRLEWAPEEDDDGDVVWPFDELCPLYSSKFESQFLELVEGFAIFNPHATIRLDWFGTEYEWEATTTDWRKWKPHQPTSSHWYDRARLERLIGAYITHDREHGTDRLVSDFLSEFDGLTGSQKRSRVLDDTDLQRVNLSEFVVDRQLGSKRIEALLAAMHKHTKPVTPQRLGEIGEDHLRQRLLAMGVEEDSFTYCRKRSSEGVPWVLEAAFGWLGDGAEDRRRIYTGVNWSAAIQNPFRSFGSMRSGLEATLTDQRVGTAEPIVFVLHLAHPRPEYTDRGKSALVIGGEQ